MPHRALLARALAATPLGALPNPYRAWVALTLLARYERPVDADRFAAELERALRSGASGARSTIDRLTDAQLAHTERGQLAPTAAGRELRAEVQARIAATIGPLYAQLDGDDAAAAGRALTRVTELIEAALGGG